LFQDYRAVRETLEKFPKNDETNVLADSKWGNIDEKVWKEDMRKQFLSKYGRIIPVDFLPQLKNMPPLPYAENLDVDSTLPNITNIPNIEIEPSILSLSKLVNIICLL
jgi:hypothetical protein